MIRSIVWSAYFGGSLVASLVLLPPYLVMLILRMKKASKRYVQSVTSFWARSLFKIIGAEVIVWGKEHIPENDRICFISNHQGRADIPLILGFVSKPIGFIAKKELSYIPVLNIWMFALRCIFIKRHNMESAHRAIERGADKIRRGNPIVIFPEGTRSRSNTMNKFKRGSIKLAVRSEATIIPLTVDGTYKLTEEEGKLKPGTVVLTIHPPIHVSKLSTDERKKLPELLEKRISSVLT
jgi:1-acyl-sn-glycerol-3-phosphate acyltransferase